MDYMNSIENLPVFPVVDGVEFRHCAGHFGYIVGSDGSVWSAWRGGGRWKERKLTTDKDGYKTVYFGKYWGKVHHLVLESFKGIRHKGCVCRHLNGNPSDNRPDNLAWGTHAENISDAIQHGTRVTLWRRGELHNQSKLTGENVAYIRANPDRLTQSQLSEKFGVCQVTISQVVTRKTWKHMP